MRSKQAEARINQWQDIMRMLCALVVVIGASVVFWASRDQAIIAPDWNEKVNGLSYNPSHLYDQNDLAEISPTQIEADVKTLATITNRIRTYSVDQGLDLVPAIARRHGMIASLGIWIGPDPEVNENEIARALRVVRDEHRAIDRVFVGNESILRGDVTPQELNKYILQVRKALPGGIKVSTAEPWNVWLANPLLAANVDFVGAHILTYWEGISSNQSLRAIKDRHEMLKSAFPGKQIVIAEVGWPSEGRSKRSATASMADQAYFIRNFVKLAAESGYDYYVIEAFDQPWKEVSEGAVGAYWGLFNAEGEQKFSFTGNLRSFPEWRTYAFTGAILGLIFGLAILFRLPRVRLSGYLVMGGLIAFVTTGMLMVVDASTLEYITAREVAFYIALIPLILLTCTMILTEGAELALSLWRENRRFVPQLVPIADARVSIHVPCYNEPPEMVIGTLNALARMSYTNFEVIVLDNNTKDCDLWRPVEEHCTALGPRFRFFHFDELQGYKAGALNKALMLTDPSAEFIAVIDSDYQVSPRWLAKAMVRFTRPEVALVQAPQDYRDRRESIFKAICYQEYRGFFRIGMVERNEQDAIIQHGTMTIVRKHALNEVGGWSEWCITEDTELGLKLFESGFSADYIPQSLGRGVMPDSLAAYMGQRYRWVYGAMQIMKRHARPIFLGGSKLTGAQRYQFLAGWLPWISDGLAMIVTAFALLWTLLMSFWPSYFDVPMVALSATALALFSAKTLKTFLLYPSKVGSGIGGALKASLAALALTHTVGKATLMGLFTSGLPFLRTPKCEHSAPLRRVLSLIWQEMSLFALCAIAILATALGHNSGDLAGIVWMVMLSIQALPYGASVVVGTLSTFVSLPLRSASYATALEEPKPVLLYLVEEKRAA